MAGRLSAYWTLDPRNDHNRDGEKVLNHRNRDTNNPWQKLDRARDGSQELRNQGAVTTGYGSPWQWWAETNRGHRWLTEALQKQTAVRPLDWLRTRHTCTRRTQTWIIQPPPHSQTHTHTLTDTARQPFRHPCWVLVKRIDKSCYFCS